MNLPLRFLPVWLRHYRRADLGADALAGVMVTLLVLPQSLAYALLAGLPPQAGLYISIFPVIAYALLGSSMVQAVGPVAITAIMTFGVLSPLSAPGSPEYQGMAAVLCLMSGLVLLAFGLLRLGFLSNLLSRPVMSGFITGSALVIVLSQVKYLVGVPEARGTLAAMQTLLHEGLEGRLFTLMIGAVALVILAFGRSALPELLGRSRLAPGRAAFLVRLVPLLVVLAGLAAVLAGDLDERAGVAVVGYVAQGLPAPHFFLPDMAAVHQLAVPALLMAFIGMVQNISMAQALAIKRGEKVDANAEIMGLGAANLVASACGGMPVGGGVSRSAVNVAAGARTPMASIVAAVAMLLVVLGAAHWFARLPLAVLAACIIVAAVSMVDLKALRQAWAYDRADGLACLGTAGGVVFLGLDVGIGLGVALSLATLLLRASQPHIAVIGRIPGTEHFRNVERHKVVTLPGVLFLRIDESLFFGNLAAVEERLHQEVRAAPDTREVVLIMSAVNRVDATAMEVLADLNRELAEQGRRLHLAEVKGPVQDRLMQSPLWSALSGKVFLSVNEAFEALSVQNQDFSI